MTRLLAPSRRLFILLVVLTVGFAQTLNPVMSGIVHAQADLAVDPKTVSPAANELRAGFQFVPEKSEQREPVPGIIVYEADFVRDQTPKNFADGPIEIKSLVAKTANAQQAAEQFTSSRQALTTASPAWVESKVAKIGDEATGLTMEGTSSEGPAVAHLFLFRRGSMVVGITVAGLTKPTRMAEAEAVAAIVLRKIDPSVKTATGPRNARPLNTQRPSGSGSGSGAGGTATAPLASASTGSGQRVRVANTGGTGVRMRADPSKTARVAAVVPEGTTLEIVGEDRKAEGLTWRNVRASGDGRGWVAGDYLVAVAGSPATGNTGQAAAPATSPAAASGAPASPAAPTGATQNADVLRVEVSVKQAKVKGTEQTVDIVVTKGGQPVANAQVTVKTSPTGETPQAPPTGPDGKTSATWKPTGSPGFIGVGVSAQAPDGVAGVGGASFEIQN